MTSDINTLTDSELVAAVAREVKPENVLPYKSGEGFYVNHLVNADGEEWGHPWRPLESFDDCFLVVDAMDSKGWDMDLNFIGDVINIERRTVEIQIEIDGNRKRAILQAALAAVRAAEGGGE